MIDRDIWTAASLLQKRHGADAAIVAAQRAYELLLLATLRVVRCGSEIPAAVTELTRTMR